MSCATGAGSLAGIWSMAWITTYSQYIQWPGGRMNTGLGYYYMPGQVQMAMGLLETSLEMQDAGALELLLDGAREQRENLLQPLALGDQQ